jgi:hypothetical protein
MKPQTARLLDFIEANPGCSILDIARGMDPFIANPRARISELRQAGHDIRCSKRKDGVDGYHVQVEAEQLTLSGAA